jgi:hypothetical protein
MSAASKACQQLVKACQQLPTLQAYQDLIPFSHFFFLFFSLPPDHAVVSSVLNIATVDELQFFGRPPSAPDSEFRRRPSQG